MRAFAATIAIAFGCGDKNTLAEFEHYWLRATAATTLSDVPHVSVGLAYLPLEEDAEECPNFDTTDFHATFGGIDLAFEARGYADGPDTCYLTFSAPETTPMNGVVTVSDSSMEIEATFELSALQMRTASHPTWRFARGETVAIQWSPAGDLEEDGDPSIGLSPSGDMTLFPTLVPPDLVTFTITATYPPGQKDGYIDLTSSQYDQPAVTCVNATECRAYQNREVHFDAVVE